MDATIPAGVIVIEKGSNKIVYANKRAVELIGFNPSGLGFKEYVVNMKIHRFEKENQTYEQLPLIKALLYGQTTRNQELTFQKPDQTQLIILTNATPLTDQKGNIIGALTIFEDITERKQAEKALKESEQLYKTIFDNSENGFQLIKILYDKAGAPYDFRYLKVNPAHERQTGLKAVNVLGKRVKELFPTIEPYWISKFGNVAKTGKSAHFENYNQSTNRWYDVYAFLYAKDQVGALFRDITEHKRAEEALCKSEREFRAFVTTISDVVYRMSPDWKEMHQLSGQNFIPNTNEPNRKWLDKYIHPEDQKQVWTVIEQAIKTKSVFELEHRVICVDGSLGWTFSRAVPSLDEKGDIIEWLGTAKDVTKRKEMEKQLKQHTEELAFERERFFSMLENLPVMVCLLTANYQVAYANRAFRAKFGESKGRRCYEYIMEKSGPCLFCESFVPFKTGKPHRWTTQCPGGTIVEVYDFPFTDVNGAKMILEAKVDITERVNLQKQLREKERLAVVGQTAGMVGHDIRNPLQAIIGDLYLLERGVQNFSWFLFLVGYGSL